MKSFKGARVLVTGASGFIGSHLVRALIAQKAEVTAAIKQESNLWRLAEIDTSFQLLTFNLLDLNGVRSAINVIQPEIVFHCICPTWIPTTPSDRLVDFQVATLGAFHLAEALLSFPPRILVNISTLQERKPINNLHLSDGKFEPITFRGAAKAAGTLLLHQAGIEKDFKVITLRLSSIYGPRQQPERLIPTAIRAALTGKSLAVVKNTIVRDFLYVDDVVSACLLAANSQATESILAVGSGTLTPIRAVVETIFQLCDVTIPTFPEFPQRSHDAVFGAADIHLTKSSLQWKPQFSLLEGLRRTIEWQRTDELKTQTSLKNN